MGYTHYWNQHRSFTDEEWKLVCAAARLVAKRFEGVLCYEYDKPDKGPEISKKMIRFNGKDEDSHETFLIRVAKRKKYDYEDAGRFKREGAFDFCKTAYKPYDGAVVLMLAAIRRLAPGVLDISSDGGAEAFELGELLDSLVREAKGESVSGDGYPKETVVKLETGCELRSPAYPEPCGYVRIVDPMVGEVAYWDAAEWKEDPEGVMGAILGAMSSKSED